MIPSSRLFLRVLNNSFTFSMLKLKRKNNLFSLIYPHINESFEQKKTSDRLQELSLRVAWAQCWLNCSLGMALGLAVRDRSQQSGETSTDSQVVWRQLHHSLGILSPRQPPTPHPSTNPAAATKVQRRRRRQHSQIPQSAAQPDPCPRSAPSQPSSSW